MNISNDLILEILDSIIKQINDKKNELNNDNWKEDLKKNELNNKLNFYSKIYKNYLNCVELLHNEDFKEEAEKEINQLNIEIKNVILDLILTNQEKEFGFFMEIKTGVGGLDAQDWNEMLLKMYINYFDKNNIKYSIVDYQGDIGIKNVTLQVEAPIINFLGEVGVHRLVRISPFNAQKKRQTSFASVYIYGNFNDNFLEIKKTDINIETFRASGAGGQHVNKTESAVRITHIPTGLVSTCQNERSQQKNKDMAMKHLQAQYNKLQQEQSKKNQQISEKEDITWGQQFRSYVLDPYKIIKDSRLNIEINSNVEVLNVLNGKIDKFINEYIIYRIINSYKEINL